MVKNGTDESKRGALSNLQLLRNEVTTGIHVPTKMTNAAASTIILR
jgi:hypothetical protein